MKKVILYSVYATVGILALLCAIGNFNAYLHRNDWKERAAPLPEATITILCANFQLEKDHPLCSGQKDVYGPDFYDLLRDTFRPYEEYEIASSEAATYEYVEERIGVFMYECDPVVDQADGFTYFICRYDLSGDREFIIGIMFTYPDNAVFRINTPMGVDGE